MATGDPGRARRLLTVAEESAAERRDRPGGATAAELLAQLDADPVLAQQAIGRWELVGDPIGQASAELVLAALGDPQAAGEVAADVARRMRAVGCLLLDSRIEAILARSAGPTHGLVIRTLGGLQVRCGGVVVDRQAWQSRKARDLLKMLLAHRGRPVPREHVAGLLWPDADAASGLKRLNVQVSTLRAVLDPERVHPSEHAIVSADGALRLDTDHAEVDVEGFLADVAAATRLDRAGRTVRHWTAGGRRKRPTPATSWPTTPTPTGRCRCARRHGWPTARWSRAWPARRPPPDGTMPRPGSGCACWSRIPSTNPRTWPWSPP